MAEIGWNSLYWNNHDQPRVVSRFGDDAPGLLGCLGEGARDRSARHARHAVHLSGRRTRDDELPVPRPAGPQGPRGRELLPQSGRSEAATGLRRWPGWRRSVGTTPARQCNGTPDRTPDSPPVEPWLPVNPNYTWLNAEAQTAAPDTVFAHYQALIRLRHELPILVDGDFAPMMAEDPQIWAYTRTGRNGKLLVIANCGREPRDRRSRRRMDRRRTAARQPVRYRAHVDVRRLWIWPAGMRVSIRLPDDDQLRSESVATSRRRSAPRNRVYIRADPVELIES